MPNPPLIVAFFPPTTCWGWVICYYQWIKGVKFWQISHVEIMAPDGVYAYRITQVLHGVPTNETLPNDTRYISIPSQVSQQSLFKRSLFIHQLWGDFSPLSPFNSKHCVTYVKFVADIKSRTTLPGKLYEELLCHKQNQHD
jgi:hypothetical protein